MASSVSELIRRRYSCRAYVAKTIAEDTQRAFADFLASLRVGPFDTKARFALVAANDEDRTSLKGLGTYGFIKGATGFVVGAVEKGARSFEDYGYLLEQAVLTATDLGLGTCWLGGTFSKSGFAKKMALTDSEIMPAVTSVGYALVEHRQRDRLRKSAGSDFRLPSEALFYDGDFSSPIMPDNVGPYATALEMVRAAPSASNKQPWRILRTASGWHFYLQRTPGYGKGSPLFTLMRLADLQRVDMGIAMCHFALTARELGLVGSWVVDEPTGAAIGEREGYTATWRPVG